MKDSGRILLLLNLAVSFYLTGAIWAHEIDIFRSWRLVDAKDFHTVQRVHWRKLPYWIFAPLGLALAGSIGLIWIHPGGSPAWAIWGNLACLLAALLLTSAVWGPWQAKLSKDPAGPDSSYLARILKTHWIRTALVNGYVIIMLVWTLKMWS